MGVVYRAVEVELSRPVALKVIAPALASQPGFRERFQRECRAAAALDHPHIIPVYAAGEHDGVLYIAMRLVEGTDLRALIAADGPIAPVRATQIVAQVAAALDSAHAHGFVHRDVKPANVLIEPRDNAEHAYLTDFGLIKGSESESGLTTAGHWVGTVDYVAPEQFRGEPVTADADVYGLGCMLYEALTGQVPFPRDNELAKLWAHASEPPPSASTLVARVPPALAAVAQRAMAKLPKDRFASAGEFGAAAVAAAHGDRAGAEIFAAPRGGVGWPVGLSRLPAPLTRTIGRDVERAGVARMLRRDDIRLVTLLGPGGVGKSRLALEVARALEGDFADGAWFVELAAVTDAVQVAGAIAEPLSITRGPGQSTEQALVRFLGRRDALLVLDNFEHLLPAAGLVSDLLAGCDALKVIATSRAPLGVQAEQRVAVEPLDVPAGGSPAEVKLSASCALFLERAESRGADLTLDAPNAQAIAEICRRLDGLPLAIELAAARVPLLEPRELNARLGHALEALGKGASDTPLRQRTLRATIDWSHRLLDPPEAQAFAHFAVFTGGATIDSAQQVTGAPLDVLEALVDKQLLLRRRGPTGTTRLQMLEIVREYARERLVAEPHSADVHRQHFLHYLDLAERAEPEMYTHGQKQWLPRLDADADNLRAALEWSLGHGEPTDALRLASLLPAFWSITRRPVEGLTWVERAIDAAGESAPIAERARAHRARSTLLISTGSHGNWQGSKEDGARRARAALELSREAGDPAGTADALLALSLFESDSVGTPTPQARELAEEALVRAREAQDDRLIAHALMTLVFVLPVDGADAEIEEAAAALRKIGDRMNLVRLYSNKAYDALVDGLTERARPLLDQALPIARELGDQGLQIAFVCGNVGLEALFSGDIDRAQGAFDEQLRVCLQHAVGWLAGEGLMGMAAIAARRGDPDLAARLMGAANAIDPTADDAVTAKVDRDFLAPARELLGEDGWRATEVEGAELSFQEAIAMALDTQRTV
jgi:non-specific serine/threonine protein kinase